MSTDVREDQPTDVVVAEAGASEQTDPRSEVMAAVKGWMDRNVIGQGESADETAIDRVLGGLENPADRLSLVHAVEGRLGLREQLPLSGSDDLSLAVLTAAVAQAAQATVQGESELG